MSYSRWAKPEEIKEKLQEVNIKKGKISSGVPLMFDKNHLYVNSKGMHNLVIGSTGSGKTQAVILPSLRLSVLKGDSIIINDPVGEIYEKTAKKIKQEGYEIVVLDFADTRKGNNWNPLTLPYTLYKEGNKDNATELIEDLGYYLFEENQKKEMDPFWINSVINYFTGLVLYLFENAKEEEINLSSVEYLSNTIINSNLEKFKKEIEKYHKINIKMSSILNAPTETRGSIISVFNQKISTYLSKENLENMLSTTDFDIQNIKNKKTIVYIISGMSSNSTNLIPLFINQAINVVSLYGTEDRHLNILLDEFDELLPIRDFARKLTICRSLDITITVTIRSFIHLQNMYSKEGVEILKMCFGCIIYLLSEDIYTLEEISKYCGNKENNKPLVTVEELKTINTFEAIVIMTRMMPIKTNMIADYKIDWGYTDEKQTLPERKINKIEKYNY